MINKKSTGAGQEAQEVAGNGPGELTALPADINLEGGVTKPEEVTETESASTGEAKASKKEAIYRLIISGHWVREIGLPIEAS